MHYMGHITTQSSLPNAPTHDDNPGNCLGFYNFICRQRINKLGLSTFRVLVFPSKFPGFLELIAFVTSRLTSSALAAEEGEIVLNI